MTAIYIVKMQGETAGEAVTAYIDSASCRFWRAHTEATAWIEFEELRAQGEKPDCILKITIKAERVE